MTKATKPSQSQSPSDGQAQTGDTDSSQAAILAQLLEAAQYQNQLLERIALAMEAGDSSNASPNYEVCLTQFRAFDWGAIDATVEQEDRDGVATVLWRGHRYVRRSAANKFEPAIWFSRSQGKDEAGNTQYARLVTFKLRPSAEPLPSKVKEVQGNT